MALIINIVIYNANGISDILKAKPIFTGIHISLRLKGKDNTSNKTMIVDAYILIVNVLLNFKLSLNNFPMPNTNPVTKNINTKYLKRYNKYNPIIAVTKKIKRSPDILVNALTGFPGFGVTDSVAILFIPNQPAIANGIKNSIHIKPEF